MHITTKALVLRDVDYKESDKILTLLTQEAGKLTASARGCRKKGSPIAAGCQLLCWSELVLYDYNGRWSVKEAAAERLFQGVRDDLEAKGYTFVSAEIEQVPDVYNQIDDPEAAKKMDKLLEMLEDNDDVQNVWHNWDRPDDEEDD